MKESRNECFITSFAAGIKKKLREVDTKETHGASQMVTRCSEKCAVEGKKESEVKQLCDTTGCSGMESALDEV